jgi:glyoxylase-like metal-dependent hydrolase (beta-lactamase superfamily II)
MLPLSRRDFLARAGAAAGGGCAAHLAAVAALLPAPLRAAWAVPRGPVVAREPFGTLERVADGVWALVSTPLGGDRTTLSNGGIVAGRSGVLAVEGFNRPEGARWLAAQARALTGRWPTHVVLTHYHADHANGVAGYLGDGARCAVHATAATRDAVVARNQPADPSRDAALRDAALRDAVLLPPGAPVALDLGARTVRVVPRAGHTSSDVSIEVDDADVVFCGDLVWNAMFPNYVDAVPTRLREAARALRRPGASTRYVPGHGAVADAAALDRYLGVLDEVERAARAAHGRGQPAADVGAAFTLPPSLGEWALFNRVFFERAFAAWYRELAR